MPPLSRDVAARGFTLVELVVALLLGTLVLGAAGQVFLATERFFRLQSSRLEVHEGMRTAIQVLVSELLELDPSDGDIVAMGRDSISIRAARGVTFVCAPTDFVGGRIVVRSDLGSGYRDVDPARDRAQVFRDGDPTTEADDTWLDLGITGAGGGAVCSDGAAATEFRLLGGVRALDSVGLGAPVRWYERVVYRLYADETGIWWLGERSWSGGAWAAISPVAGPLAHPLGLEFAYFDASGVPTSEPTRVAGIGLTVRGVSTTLLQAAGGGQSRWADSLATVVFPRNGRQ